MKTQRVQKRNGGNPRSKRKRTEEKSPRLNVVMCGVWVAREKANLNPTRGDISDEEEEKKERVKHKKKDEKKDEIEEQLEDETEEEEADKKKIPEKLEDETEEEEADSEDESEIDADESNLDKLYDMSGYDEEDLGADEFSESQDPLMEEDSEGERSEDEDHMLKPEDNLVALARVEQSQEDHHFTLEVYVYNADEGSFYPHHDRPMAYTPVCMEWVGYHGNQVAMGNADHFIELWDLDDTMALEPALTLGKPTKKKASTFIHSHAVTSLAWCRHSDYDYILCSGAADGSVLCWDLQERRVLLRFELGAGVINSVMWHPVSPLLLTAASSAPNLFVIDCLKLKANQKDIILTEDKCAKWKLTLPAESGEMEDHLWADDNRLLVSDSKGNIHCYEKTNEKTSFLWTVKAHETTCSALAISSSCPGLLVSTSEDGKMSVWDTKTDEKIEFVAKLDPKVGRIMSCKASPDQPFVFLVCGDQGDNTHRVWDLRNSLAVRLRFCERLGLPTDSEEVNESQLDSDVSSDESDEESDEEEEAEDSHLKVMQEAFEEECHILSKTSKNKKKKRKIEE